MSIPEARPSYGAQGSAERSGEAQDSDIAGCSSSGGHEEPSTTTWTSNFQSVNNYVLLAQDDPGDSAAVVGTTTNHGKHRRQTNSSLTGHGSIVSNNGETGVTGHRHIHVVNLTRHVPLEADRQWLSVSRPVVEHSFSQGQSSHMIRHGSVCEAATSNTQTNSQTDAQRCMGPTTTDATAPMCSENDTGDINNMVTARHGTSLWDATDGSGQQQQRTTRIVDSQTHAMVALIAGEQDDVKTHVFENVLDGVETMLPHANYTDSFDQEQYAVATVQSQRILRERRALPTVWGTINDKSVQMLVDTGAQVSIMAASLVHIIGAELRRGMGSVRMASNSRVNCMGECTADIALGSQVFTLDFIVLQDASQPIILGQDFLAPVKAQIDLDAFCLHVNGERLAFAKEKWSAGFIVKTVNDIDLAPGKNIFDVQLVNSKQGHRMVWPVDNLWEQNLYAEAALIEVDENGRGKWAITNMNPFPLLCKNTEYIAYWDGEEEVAQADIFTVVSDNQNTFSWLDGFKIHELGLTDQQQEQLLQVLMDNQAAISKTADDVGLCRNEECSIDTGDAKPIKLRWRRLAPIKQAAVDEAVSSMLQRGLIRHSFSPWSSPIVVVAKKSPDGSPKFRVCTDYRNLNQVTVKDSFPLPDVTRILEELNGNSWFSTLDLTSGYLQVPVATRDQAKTAFTTRDGHYEYLVLPFGLTNAPSQFCRIMSKIFAQSKFCTSVYMDDIVVRARSFEQSLEHLDHVLKKLAEAGLKVRPDKCKLLQRQVHFLGHVVSAEGVQADPQKTEAIQRWPTPRDKKEVSSFLGLCGYYQRFVQNYSTIARPLHALSSQSVPWEWTQECAEAFATLKEKLSSPPILGYPDFEGGGEFIIDVDASDVAAGAVLSQVQDGQEKVLAYGHKSFTESQRRYCTTMKELCALVYFIQKYRDMVWGCHTTVRTDHQALLWLRKVHSSESMLDRWYFVLEEALELECDVQSTLESAKWTVVHRPGKHHMNADALSRQQRKPKKHHVDCPSCADLFVNGTDNLPTTPVVAALGLEDAFQMVRRWQEEDATWQQLRQLVQRHGSQPAPRDFAASSEEIQCLVNQWQRLTVVDGLLCWRNKAQKPKVVVPELHRATLLKLYHYTPGTLHEGANKMLSRIAEKFYWRNLQRDIQLYVSDCDTCTQLKTHRKVREGLEPLPMAYPNQRVHIDFLGPVTESIAGHAYIFVAVDAFSNYASAWPTRGTSAVDALNCLLEWFALFGLPAWIHSDRGTAFESELMGLICHQFGISHTMSSAWHPQTNGKGELCVKHVKKALALHVKTFGTRWNTALKFALLTLRSGINVRTGVSPATLFLGREMRTMCDMVAGVDTSKLDKNKKTSFAKQVLHDIEQTNTHVRSKLSAAQQKSKDYFDKHVFSINIKIGSRVLRWDYATAARKEGYSGPYLVTDFNGKRAHLQLETTKQDVGWVTRDRLRLLGDDTKWQNDTDKDLWAKPKEHVEIDNRKYLQTVGGGVHLNNRTTNQSTTTADGQQTRINPPRKTKQVAQQALLTVAERAQTPRRNAENVNNNDNEERPLTRKQKANMRRADRRAAKSYLRMDDAPVIATIMLEMRSNTAVQKSVKSWRRPPFSGWPQIRPTSGWNIERRRHHSWRDDTAWPRERVRDFCRI